MEDRLCPHCGAKLETLLDAFCSECHGDLSEAPLPAAPSDPSYRRDARESRRIPGPARQWAAVGATLGLFTGVWTLANQNAQGENPFNDVAYVIGYLMGSAVCPGISGFVFGFVVYHFIRWLRPSAYNAR